MFVRITKKLAVFAAAFVLLCSSASACPTCKNANEADKNKPRAYMYSILFMIGMPATIFTGFGVSFYRMTKRESLELAELNENSEDQNQA